MPCHVSRYLTLLIVTWFTGQLAAPCWGSAGNEDATLRITVNQLADSEGSVRSAAIEKLCWKRRGANNWTKDHILIRGLQRGIGFHDYNLDNNEQMQVIS